MKAQKNVKAILISEIALVHCRACLMYILFAKKNQNCFLKQCYGCISLWSWIVAVSGLSNDSGSKAFNMQCIKSTVYLFAGTI